MKLLKYLKEDFKEKIFDFEKEKKWNYKGNKHCIIDFYADWCAPCKIVHPILEDLNEEFKEEINIYKIDTEDQQELAQVFGIMSIPSILFIPKNGKPQMAQGAIPKDSFYKAIKDVFNIQK
jgi:thioredoxin